MGQSYRIRTEVGVNKTINVHLDQDFEFLEILSLKLQQSEIYNRDCANYGVVVGRVTANNGFGIPNAKVSIFLPIRPEDQSDPLINSIYPYRNPEEKNEDGYRYNLLPYEKSYSSHAATGTFPSLSDVLNDDVAIEIYDTYYKLTSKTNDSGDYMIMGVPLGAQTLVMDVDLSDIGEFSLSPQDLIRMGIATEAQVGGNTFKTSNDLNSLPQIINIVKTIEVSPLWGDQDICQIAINRLDFDLRDDANVDITPTAVFMGSIFSSPENMRIRPGFKFLGLPLVSSAKPKDNLGNLCNLVAGPGQILCIRQTVNQDQEGNPILEEYKLEKSGNVIDGDGTWLVEVPMNLDYIITNEFGEKVISFDSKVGIPTKGKYRFKVKWQQPPTLTEQNRRAYFLVPNVKEYGWDNTECDPNIEYPLDNFCNSTITVNDKKKLNSSYYFGLDWSGYTEGFLPSERIERLNEIIDCEDSFYEFNYNKVYTVSSLIDQWKRGGRGRFIGIKEIDDNQCSSTINKFPVNEGFQNFDFLYFLFSILVTLLSFTFIPLLIVGHIILFLYSIVINAICWICNIRILRTKPFQGLCTFLRISCRTNRFTIRLPMITYPECSTCECKTGEITTEYIGGGTTGSLSYLSSPSSYINKLLEYIEQNSNGDFPDNNDTESEFSIMFAQAMSGNDNTSKEKGVFKVTKSDKFKVRSDDGDEDDEDWAFAFSKDLPLGERVNIFNGRFNYFTGLNRIKVSFDSPKNPNKFHYDNTITVMANQQFNSGDLLTFVDVNTTSDINFKYTATTQDGIIRGIEGVSENQEFEINVSYSNPNNPNNNLNTEYTISSGTTVNRYIYPSDREYYQVITAITVSEAISLFNPLSPVHSFPDVITSDMDISYSEKDTNLSNYEIKKTISFKPIDYFENKDDEYVLILQRGVDPYSPKMVNEYSVGKIFGYPSEDEIGFVFTASTRLNIPIQSLPNNYGLTVQKFDKDDMYHESYFFKPGSDYSAYTSNSVWYYSGLDKTNTFSPPPWVSDNQNSDIVFANNTIGNNYVDNNISSAKYDLFEDLSGGACMIIYVDENSFRNTITYYLSRTVDQNKLLTYLRDDKDKLILRTDRLPTSDGLNGYDWNEQSALLQQNNNFRIYLVPEPDENSEIPTYSTGAQQIRPDTEGLPGNTRVLESFDCEKMVSLKCYEGFGDNFRVNQKCADKDNVERGCYLLLRRPLIDLFNGKDFKTYGEWSLRFRFFYGLCRGVLSQSFTNNWINGTLFAFPIQVNTFYDSKNKPFSTFPRELIYFDQGTTNFYYRSSPYNISNKRFVGKNAEPSGLFKLKTSVNDENLLFPTTIMDLGMKEKFYSEIIYEPYSRSYTISSLNTTSYSDVSDIVNLFVISRITDAGFLDAIIPVGDNSITELFTRNTEIGNFFEKNLKRRVDGDFAQAVSINSEIGLINFSPEYYETPPCDDTWCETNCCLFQITNNDTEVMTITYSDCDDLVRSIQLTAGETTNQPIAVGDIRTFEFSINNNPTINYTLVNFGCATNESPTRVLGTQKDPVIAIWFSSTTENLQLKDFITPGRLNFRTNDLLNNFPFTYGIKSQRVPFYQWEIKRSNNIFGTQFNNWYTKGPNFFSAKYQSLDRVIQPPDSYFQSNEIPSGNNKDLNQRGYIFSVDSDGKYSVNGNFPGVNKYLVGAPFHFYFGINRGFSALDKFKTKYSVDE
jgi:hypothetical protein